MSAPLEKMNPPSRERRSPGVGEPCQPRASAECASRYSRQSLFAPIGESGQKKIQEGSAVIVGCGALGTVAANNLARAGVGRIRIVDRDFVELSNLQRQVLLDENDALRRLPKAVAAVEKLRQINSSIALEAVVSDVNPRSVEELIGGFSVLIDATDNMESRFLLNDACVRHGIPWVYGAALGSTGMTMPIIPGRTACLRCLLSEKPPTGTMPTCDREGILNTVTAIIGSLQSTIALKILVGTLEMPWQLVFIDVWQGEFKKLDVSRKADCLTCARRKFEFLDGSATSWTTALCGRNMVQISPPEAKLISLETLARSLARRGGLSGVGDVFRNEYLLTLKVEGCELIVFPTGRVMVKGTTDESVARALCARYIGM